MLKISCTLVTYNTLELMNVKKILILIFISMSITALLNEAKAQNRKLFAMEGIIFYFDTDSIPQEVYLIPVKLNYKGDFEDFVHKTLDSFQGKALDVYFQGMRWMMPNLLEEVQNMKYITAETAEYITPEFANSNFIKPLRGSACKIYTNLTHAEMLTFYADKGIKFVIKIGEKRYTIPIGNLKPEYCVPTYFEPMLTFH